MYLIAVLPCPYCGGEVSTYCDGSGYCHVCCAYFPAFSFPYTYPWEHAKKVLPDAFPPDPPGEYDWGDKGGEGSDGPPLEQ